MTDDKKMILNAPWLHGPAKFVCNLLEANDYEAWFVGGCVRNQIIGRPVADLDLSTNARPEMVFRLFEDAGFRVIPSGIDHGTITVMSGDEPIEITTFRRDIATDGRRAVVSFSNNMEDDALRRDFTMNALYCNIRGEVADPLGGLEDLKAGRVVFIEDADQRIREDYLRILRFFRFNALYFSDASSKFDPEGLEACEANAGGIQKLSAERITSEMMKILGADNPRPTLKMMHETGVLDVIIPGADLQTFENLVGIERDAGVEVDPILRLSSLGGKLDCFRLSKLDQIAVDLYTNGFKSSEGMSPAEMGQRFDEDICKNIVMIKSAQEGLPLDKYVLNEISRGAQQVFPMSAKDVMPEKQGKEIGEALQKMITAWIASDFTLGREDLMKHLRETEETPEP